MVQLCMLSLSQALQYDLAGCLHFSGEIKNDLRIIMYLMYQFLSSISRQNFDQMGTKTNRCYEKQWGLRVKSNENLTERDC